MEQPRSIITLKQADERDKMLYVTETTQEVASIVQRGTLHDEPLITLTRVVGMQAVDFRTQPGNILNVTEYR